MTYLTAPPGRPGGEEGRMDAKGDCHLLFVPVHESGPGVLALRTGRLPSGQRVPPTPAASCHPHAPTSNHGDAASWCT